jgi:hypothetical protein
VGCPGRICRGLVYWGLEKALKTGTLLHRGPVKNHGGVRSPGTLIVERGLWRRSVKGTWRGASLLGTLKVT